MERSFDRHPSEVVSLYSRKMKTLRLLVLFFCLALLGVSAEVEVECKLIFESPPIRFEGQEAPQGEVKVVNAAVFFVLSNRGPESARVMTDGALSSIVKDGPDFRILLKWDMPADWRGRRFLLPSHKYGVVELRPGERTMGVAKVELPASIYERIIGIDGMVDEELAQRYSVARLNWQHIIKK